MALRYNKGPQNQPKSVLDIFHEKKRGKALDKLVVWLAESGVPPNAVVSDAWADFMSCTQAGYKKLNYGAINAVLSRMEQEVRDHIKKEIDTNKRTRTHTHTAT